MATSELKTTDLEQELADLLEVDRFEPPPEFKEAALWSDPSVYEEAAADPEAWWLRQATELLDWIEEPSAGLDESNPPFYKWFADGKLNASANCLAPHVEAGRGARPARGGRAAGAGSPSTGTARRASSATSPMPTSSPTSSASPTPCANAGSRR